MQANAMSGLSVTASTTSRAMSRSSPSALRSLCRFCSSRSSRRFDRFNWCSTDGARSASANTPAYSGGFECVKCVPFDMMIPELNGGQAFQRERQGLVLFGEAEADDAGLLAVPVKRRHGNRRDLDLGGQPFRELRLGLCRYRVVAHALEIAAVGRQQFEARAAQAGAEQVALALVKRRQLQIRLRVRHIGGDAVLHRRVDAEDV